MNHNEEGKESGSNMYGGSNEFACKHFCFRLLLGVARLASLVGLAFSILDSGGYIQPIESLNERKFAVVQGALTLADWLALTP